MSRTMVANIPGARLREVERELAKARGEAAVNAVIEAHPNETKVLQQLVEWRRAGKNVPPLTRVQRVMLWSDSSIELSAALLPESPARGGARGGFGGREAPRGRSGAAPAASGRSTPSGARGPQRSGAGPQRTAGESARPGGPGGPGGSPRPGAGSQRLGGGQPARAAGGSERSGGGRDRFGGRPGDRRDGGPRAVRPEGARRYIFAEGQEGGERRPPPARGGRPGFRRGERDQERDTHGLPRAGEGWVLLREGEAPPPGPTLGGGETGPAPHEAAVEPAGASPPPVEPTEGPERAEATQDLASGGAVDNAQAENALEALEKTGVGA